MKKSLTFLKQAVLLKGIALIAFIMAFGQVQAQVVLSVESPANVAGEYGIVIGNFGLTDPCAIDVSGELAFIDDGTALPTEGCEPAVNDLTGKIAVIDRGSCAFTQKSINAQNAGAIAVVICNNNPAEDAIGMAGEDATIVVPCVNLSFADCATIRVAIPGATAHLGQSGNVIPPSGMVFYEEDFNDGPNGWTSVALQGNEDETFIWSETGNFPHFGNNVAIGLAGALCTGAMGMPSGWYQTGMTGDVSVAVQPYNQYVTELISPALDLSAVEVPLALEFSQLIQRLNITGGQVHFSFVNYSTDGGDTWSDPIIVNAELETNSADVTTPPLNSVEKVGLSGIEGQSNVRIKFTWASDFYYWAIDNIRLVDRDKYDLTVNPFFAIPNNAVIPASQVEPIYFMADIANVGSDTQNDVNLNISISNSAGDVVHTDDFNYGTVEGDQTVENMEFANSWTPTAADTYTGTYMITSDNEDVNPLNNIRTFTMEVSDTIFSKGNENTNFIAPGSGWDDGAPHSWAMGNHYHMVNNELDGEDLVVSTVTVGLSNTAGLAEQQAQGNGVQLWLYEWVDDGNGNFEEGELVAVAFNQVVFDGDGSGTPAFLEYTLPLVDLNSATGALGSTPLKANTDYILMAQFTDLDGTGDTDTDFVLLGTDAHNYGAQVFMNAPMEVNVDGVLTGLGIGSRRYASILLLPVDGDFTTGSDVFANGFGDDLTPLINLNVTKASEAYVPVPDMPDAATTLSDDNIIDLFPNPTSDKLAVQLDLVNTADNMIVKIVNTRGQEMLTQKYSNIQKENISFDVSNYAVGTYYITITTETGVKMKKFVVQR